MVLTLILSKKKKSLEHY